MQAQRQSALDRYHQQANGNLQPFAGWQLPAWYTEPSLELAQVRAGVGISDASYLTKLDLRGSANNFLLEPPARVWNLTPAHTLVTSPSYISFAHSNSVTDVTSIYSAILLAGPHSRAVLHKLTTLNARDAALPNGAARQTRLAHVNAMILRYDSAGLPGFLILNTRDVAEHVWESLRQAGDVSLFGTIAQQQWMVGAV